MDQNFQEICIDVLNNLEAIGINFLAIDFDLTLISEHTGGTWAGTADELKTKIRPFFKHLIPLAIERNMCVAIVTFSPQVFLISEVLRLQFPSIASRIPIRGNDGSWAYEGRGAKDGKQSHMASAAEDFEHLMQITRHSTILLDDDANNVRIALYNHTNAVLMRPNDWRQSVEMLKSLKNVAEAGKRESQKGKVSN